MMVKLVGMAMMLLTSPQSCRGILPPRHGNQQANLPWRDTHMQPLLCHLRFYHLNAFSVKVIGQICLIWNTCFSFFNSCLFAFVILILDLPYTPHIVSLLCCSFLWIGHIIYDMIYQAREFHIIDLIDLYFELSGTNMLLKKQIIHIIYNELTASGKLGSSNVNNMFCALEY